LVERLRQISIETIIDPLVQTVTILFWNPGFQRPQPNLCLVSQAPSRLRRLYAILRIGNGGSQAGDGAFRLEHVTLSHSILLTLLANGQ